MMVLVTRGPGLLLARANRFPGAMYSALAGFVEAGESNEDCIHREVREECGIEVRDLRYFTSPAGQSPHSLTPPHPPQTAPRRPRARYTPEGDLFPKLAGQVAFLSC